MNDLAEQISRLNAARDAAYAFDEAGWLPQQWSLGALAFRLPPAPYEAAAPTGATLEIFPLKYWYRLSYHFAIGAMNNTGSKLWLKASSEHVVAYSLLYDWWTARYQDPAFSQSARDALGEDYAYDTATEAKDEAGMVASRMVQNHLRLKTELTCGVADTAAQYSKPGADLPRTYDLEMWDWFLYEFLMIGGYFPHQEEGSDRERRVSLRKTGIVQAYVQYLSWSAFEVSSPPKGDSLNKSADSAHGPAAEANQRKRNVIKSLGRSLFSKALSHSRKDSNVDPEEATSSSAHQATTSNIAGTAASDEDLDGKYGQIDIAARGPVLDPCPWSTAGHVMDELYDFPRYLWDREEGCTVVVSKLLESNTFSSYIAVSHTWGRWYKDNPIAVDGVPWLVPQNSRFEVKDLHNILRAIPSKLRYVWMDLLCIPQDRSKEGAMEISRQAKIFRGAEEAMAWFTDVETFEGLGNILKWWTLELLQVHGKAREEHRVSTKENAWAAIHGQQSGLMEPRSGEFTPDVRGLNPWFTSLWTLQEVCLRPDMLLCAHDWKPLSCDGITPVPISGLVAAMETRNPTIIQRAIKPGPSKIPIPIFELRLWGLKSELQKLLHLDRAAIITLGDRRQCKERRAEAIMSALGTVEWYNKALADHGPERLNEVLEQDLVLGKYPLAFLNELAKEVPADFFGAFRRADVKAVAGGPSPWSTLPKEGTMMPFCRTEAFFADGRALKAKSFGDSIMTHESLRTWRVEQSGAARLPKVCLVSSKEIAAEAMKQKKVLPGAITAHQRKPSELCVLPAEIRAKVSGYLPLFDESHEQGNFDLHAWILESPCEVYAILTSYLEYHHKEFKMKLKNGSITILERVGGNLVKAGDILVTDTESNLDIDDSRDVDWLVV